MVRALLFRPLMLARITLLAGVIAVVCLSSACSSEGIADGGGPNSLAASDGASSKKKPLVVRDDVVRTPASLSEEAIVEPDQIRVPVSVRKEIADVVAGSVVIGEASKSHPEQNPVGFLRRVSAIKEGTKEIILETKGANLRDVYASGDFDFTFIGKQKQSHHIAGDPDFKNDFEGGIGGEPLNLPIPKLPLVSLKEVLPPNSVVDKAEGTVELNGGNIMFNPYARLSVDFGYDSPVPGIATSIKKASAELGVDYDVHVSVKVSAKLTNGRPLVFKGKELKRELVGWQRLAGGLLPFPPYLPYTVKARATAQCTWSSAGAINVTAEGGIKGKPYVKLVYAADGGWSYEGDPVDVEPYGDLDVALEGQLGLKCSITPELGVFIIDLAGPTLAGGPFIDLTAKSTTDCPPPGFAVTAKPGVEVSFGGEVTLLGLFTVGAKAFSKSLDGPTTVVLGTACGTVSANPCAGKAQGYYCGADINGNAGEQYFCDKGKTVEHVPCPNACINNGGGNVVCE